jgi:hypothetical protein
MSPLSTPPDPAVAAELGRMRSLMETTVQAMDERSIETRKLTILALVLSCSRALVLSCSRALVLSCSRALGLERPRCLGLPRGGNRGAPVAQPYPPPYLRTRKQAYLQALCSVCSRLIIRRRMTSVRGFESRPLRSRPADRLLRRCSRRLERRTTVSRAASVGISARLVPSPCRTHEAQRRRRGGGGRTRAGVSYETHRARLHRPRAQRRPC